MKALELQFGLRDRPNLWVTLGSAIQHVLLGLVTLTFPLMLINETYPASLLPPDEVYTLMAASFVALGIATLLQAGLVASASSPSVSSQDVSNSAHLTLKPAPMMQSLNVPTPLNQPFRQLKEVHA